MYFTICVIDDMVPCAIRSQNEETPDVSHQIDQPRPATSNTRSHAMTSSTPSSSQIDPEARRAVIHQRRWGTLAVLCLSLLITVLDTTVVSVALPTLDRALHASSSGLEWIVDSYTLVFAGLLMLGGALGDRYGRHRALPTGLAIFAAGSVIAALAGSVDQLIAARAVMGAGAALVMPATLSILTSVFTDHAERAKAIGIWSAVSGLGVAVGPTLGGLLLQHFSWSSIFLINIPIVAVALIAGRRLVPVSRAPKSPRIDVVGAALSVAGLSALTYTLIQAPSNGWTSASTITTGVAAVGLLGVFAIQQIRRPDPLIDLRLFANPGFSAASGAVMALFFALTSATFVLTQIYQFVLSYSPLGAGLRALAPAMMVAIGTPIGAKIAAHKGPRLPITAGPLLATGGLLLFASASPSSGYLHYMVAMTFVGFGIGLSMAPATHSIMSSVPPAKAGVGSAINDTTRNLGGVLGVAIIGSIVASGYKTSLASTTTHLGRHLQAIVSQSVGLATEIAKHLPGTSGQHLIAGAHDAFVNAATHGILIAAAPTLIGAIVAARYLPGPAPVPSPARPELDSPEHAVAATA
jgi:EmrB/QacA subfamily drug resistance transporter